MPAVAVLGRPLTPAPPPGTTRRLGRTMQAPHERALKVHTMTVSNRRCPRCVVDSRDQRTTLVHEGRSARAHQGGCSMIRTGLTDEEQGEVWRRYRTGESMRSISRALRPSLDQIRRVIHATGGRSPRRRRRTGRRLTLAEREEILRGVAAGDSCRGIARLLARAPSTVSRELVRNGGRRQYRAHRAEAAARRRARRPKTPKLACRCGLRRVASVRPACPRPSGSSG